MNTVSCFSLNAPVLHFSSGKFTAGKNWQHKHMYHEGNFEIIIVIHGKLFLQIDQNKLQITAGEAFALPPYHHLCGYQFSPEGTQYFWFHFFVKPGGLKNIQFKTKREIIDTIFKKTDALLPLQFKICEKNKTFLLANQILDVSKGNYFTPLAVDYLLTELIIQLADDYHKQLSGTLISMKKNRVDTIKDWIRANLNSHLKVTDVANAFNLNARYLVRFFKHETGQTVIAYINQLKMDKAKELLIRSDLSIKQVAGEVYFEDEKRFMKVFKNNFNLTPTEFRRAYTRKFLDSSRFDPEVPIKQTPERQ
ncbi:AraC family transcriptional regulator [Furfurilactobacillus rossiae]|uniref:AraC family transcriptional regulator n=1 Tax=Furfurilactobacillus rossiae TaxID=231049 RepID=UPI0002EBC04C|nr:AraC family transcriptional regulator [Furfurilactobacillus rossiae]QFR67165.1 helix-turn-helix domain-containing protein [Furfurilactobacillus rossiae]QLE60086.1 DNA-binding response regulator AraC [Furfurilactobacillus rossiae]